MRRKTEKFKVLIVEDDPSIQAMLNDYLSANDGRVKILDDGESLLRQCKKSPPDIILLDVVLPGDDGFTLLRKLRGAGIATPVIMLTERSAIDDKVLGLEVGADDYLAKPFDTRELLARIQNQLRRDKKPLKSVKISGIRIDPATREARDADGTLLPLTKSEFDLFFCLIKRSPQVIEHSELFTVLGYTKSETKSLVIHVANLRRKLASIAAAGVFHIQSVPKVGYKLTIKK